MIDKQGKTIKVGDIVRVDGPGVGNGIGRVKRIVPGPKADVRGDNWMAWVMPSEVDRMFSEPNQQSADSLPPQASTPIELISARNARRCLESFHSVTDWSPNDWATALSGEVGELCNFLKKRRRGEKIPDKAIADEMADVFIYLDLLATRCGINLNAAIVSKFNEVSERVGSRERL